MVYIILWFVIGYIFASLATYFENGFNLTNRDLIEGLLYMFLGIICVGAAIGTFFISIKKHPDHKMSKKINEFLNKKIV